MLVLMSNALNVDLNDQDEMKAWLPDRPDRPDRPDTERVVGFVAGPGIQKIDLKFDIEKLRQALEQIIKTTDYCGEQEHRDKGFGAISLTRRPGVEKETANGLSGRFWLLADGNMSRSHRKSWSMNSPSPNFCRSFAAATLKKCTRR
jgi:hypothetical protein